ncbi:3-phenylpropionate/cinnamic acid dioxygenase subunit beta [Escherichia sp. WS453]|nr:3-phenylpropionate/cinnamic acid dioxygenase subunit beta [Escherichia coli]
MSAQVSLELHHRISQFLFHEASLLDDWKFRDWLAQLDEEIRYTMRTTVNAQTRDRRKGVQPPTTWIFNDTKDQLERRIARLETGMAWAEEPPSRTRHLISNCQISETDIPNVFAVRVNYLLYRAQKERDETFYVGTRFDKVRRLEDDNWRLLERDIVLFNVGGEFYAINDRCSHGNASMSEGYLEDDATVECPLHAASFCLKTGKALCLPATDPLTTYPVHVEGGDIFIDLPEAQP